MSVNLSHEQVMEEMTTACPWWSAAEWTTFTTELSPDEQAAMAQIAQDSPKAPGVNGWTTALTILETAATVVGAVVGLGSGVTAIKALIKTL